jgi:outer membrane immunogenic protein
MEIRMKKAGVIAAALLFAGPAFAADLGARPSYRGAPVFSWSGCYVGADVGGAWPRQDASVTPSAATNQGALVGSFPNTGNVIGGPHAGCNYQFIPAWAVGLEGDFSWTRLNGDASGPNVDLLPPQGIAPGGSLLSRSTDWVASVRGRLGWVVVPNALIYGTGGVAWAHSNYTGSDSLFRGLDNAGAPILSTLATSFSDTHIGWVAGGGIEWAPWSNNWLVRFEYLHYQFGGISSIVTDSIDPTQFVNFGFGDLTIDTVRAGLSYKF